MKRSVLIAAVFCALLGAQPLNPPAAAVDLDVRGKLAASRDALVAQLREIQRSIDDVNRQMDELRRKQALLDSYRRETDSAITEVERAMAQTR